MVIAIHLLLVKSKVDLAVVKHGNDAIKHMQKSSYLAVWGESGSEIQSIA